MDSLQLILFILPAYFANSVPVISGGRSPIDFGHKFIDNRRLLGPGKTLRGLLFGIGGALFSGVILAQFPQYYLPQFNFNEKIAIALLMGAGTLFGDAVGSFIKRRRGMERGTESRFTDKLLFVFFALAFSYPVFSQKIQLTITDIVILVLLTLLLHVCFNRLAHWLKLKNVPW